MTNQPNKWIAKKFKELRKTFPNRCSHTGTKKQFAHTKKTPLTGIKGRGRKERYYDIKNHPNSYKLLCKKCHKKRGNP